MHPGTGPDASRSSSSRQSSQPSSGALASFSSEDIVAVKRAEESVWLQQEQRRIRWLQRLKEKISDEEEREFECVQKAKRARLSRSRIPRTGPTTHRNEKSRVNRPRPRAREEELRLDSERESTEIRILPEAYCGSDDDIESDEDSSDDEALGDKDDRRNDGADHAVIGLRLIHTVDVVAYARKTDGKYQSEDRKGKRQGDAGRCDGHEQDAATPSKGSNSFRLSGDEHALTTQADMSGKTGNDLPYDCAGDGTALLPNLGPCYYSISSTDQYALMTYDDGLPS
ncbi:hypothetical protein FOZ62_001234 [Perkinsus olseni]|uniref:Uncharacterized protein n=1 Tax=Perkinsus olseni TaxID=32597 RepID=A0A7J6SJG8_PEROL|nr:hypothetical protein FOZ62_001234 [Perkinsus olseni]